MLRQLLAAMKENKGSIEEKTEPAVDEEEENTTIGDGQVEQDLSENQQDVTTPVIEITPNLGVSELTYKMEQTNLSPRRRLSSSAKLKRQPNSISGLSY